MKNQEMKNVAAVAVLGGATLVGLVTKKIVKTIKSDKKEAETFEQDYEEPEEEAEVESIDHVDMRTKAYYDFGFKYGRNHAQDGSRHTGWMRDTDEPELRKAQEDGYEAGYTSEKSRLKTEFDNSVAALDKGLNDVYDEFVTRCPNATEWEKERWKDRMDENRVLSVEKLKEIYHQQ